MFPTASKRRANIFARIPIHQWFDNWSLQTPTENEELQFDGLRESSIYIHRLLETEIAAVGAKNVVLWGLSQGMAISMVSLLLSEGSEIAAVVGMCGWLPLRKRMEDMIRDEDLLHDEDNPFASTNQEVLDASIGEMLPQNEAIAFKFEKAVRYLREELQMPDKSESYILPRVPNFLGHGTEDEKVPLELDREAADFLRFLDFDVEYREYDGLTHWYSGQMLQDIIQFFQLKTELQSASYKSDEVETE